MKPRSHRQFQSGHSDWPAHQPELIERHEPLHEDVSVAPSEEPDDASDLDDFDLPRSDDDSRWDVFIPDDDERDPLPDPGDFSGSMEPGARSEEPD